MSNRRAMNFNHLKKVRPIENSAPEIKDGDIKWSKAFDLAAELLESRQKHALCYALDSCVDNDQSHRMGAYVCGLLDDYIFVRGWLQHHNDLNTINAIDLNIYRASWARHLAEQFRSKGL